MVQFYETDDRLIEVVVRFVIDGLAEGGVNVVLMTPPHQQALEQRLAALGVDLARARAHRRYVPMDAAGTLARLMVDGVPDADRFAEMVGTVIRDAAGRSPHVRAFGEMAALLWLDANPVAALRLERLWSELADRIGFLQLCAYPMRAFAGESDAARFRAVCEQHADVIPAEEYLALRNARAQLQQQRVDRAALETLRSNFAAIVESSDDAIIGKTLDGIVTSWNPAAERIFGYTEAEMVGQPISRIMPPERQGDMAVILQAIRAGERVDHFETERIRKDGVRVPISVTVSPIRDEAGRTIGASKIARDISERRRNEATREELLRMSERARAEAERVNRRKDEFLAMLGHELRNPLSAVRNAIITARLDPEQRTRALDIARRQADHLARLVDDLLDVARINQGKIALHRERVDVADVIHAAMELTRAIVEDRGHAVRVSPVHGPIVLDADPIRLEQVLVNLLTNAAKYTPAGGRIDVVAERDGDTCVLRVRDTGAGIAPDMLSRVFDLFAQEERELSRSQGGLGIGLTIVRQVVELHGGRVEARSEGLGRGAEFIVRLPAVPAGDDTATARGPMATPAASARFKMLLVEDNPDAAESLAMLLQLLGHDVRVTGDGGAALEMAVASVPDVMVVDIGLPGIDGYEVARRVRRDPRLHPVIMIALTGYGRDQDRETALDAGFDHHLVKPVEPEALERLVSRLRS